MSWAAWATAAGIDAPGVAVTWNLYGVYVWTIEFTASNTEA